MSGLVVFGKLCAANHAERMNLVALKTASRAINCLDGRVDQLILGLIQILVSILNLFHKNGVGDNVVIVLYDAFKELGFPLRYFQQSLSIF